MKNIYYAPKMEGYIDEYYHPLFENEVYLPLKPYLQYYKEYHSKHTYWECPAWKEYYKNCFVIFSQIDMKVIYDKSTGIIQRESYNYCIFDEGNDGPVMNDFPYELSVNGGRLPFNGIAVGQIKQHYVFWTDHKNLWAEIISPPDILKTLGMELITAEYPFSRWHRPLLCAYKFHNEETIIKRGTPIGVVKFKNTKKYNDKFNLERKDPPITIKRKSLNHSLLKKFLPKQSWDLIRNDSESKCPFKKFWS